MRTSNHTVSPAAAGALLRQGTARILDVRSPGEFESAHIGGSYNVPLDTLGEHAREIGTNVASTLILVCQSGQRARKADEALSSVGMSNVHVLEGGINAWIAEGFDVVRGRRRMSIERQVRVVAGALAGGGGFLALAVNPLFAAIPAAVGSGLVFAGLTDTCAMGLLLARMPFNRTVSCDLKAIVQALATGANPETARTSYPASLASTSSRSA